MKFLFSICVIFYFRNCLCRELKFVQAIWRHGDRAPSKLAYPNDPYNETYWPRGWNQLTNVRFKRKSKVLAGHDTDV